MPDKELNIEIGGKDEALRDIEEIRAALGRATDEAIKFSNAIRAGQGDDQTRAQLMGAMRNVSNLRGALSAVQGTASANPATATGTGGGGWRNPYFPGGLGVPTGPGPAGWAGAYGGYAGGGAGYYGPGGAPPGGAGGGFGGGAGGAGAPVMPPMPPGGYPSPYGFSLPPWNANAALRGILYTAGTTASNYLELATQQTLTGRVNPMDMYRIGGGLIGGIGGALVGGFFGPFGGLLGAGVGMKFGNSVSDFVFSTQQAHLNASEALLPLRGTFGRNTIPYSQGGMAYRMEEIARGAGRFFGVSGADVAQGYTGTVESLIAGGVNPFVKTGSYVYGADRLADVSGHFFDNVGRGANGRAFADVGLSAIIAQGVGRETLGEAITRRAYNLYHSAGTDILKGLAPVYAAMGETGGNLTDILSRFGPTRTLQYERLSNDQNRAEIGFDDLLRVSGGMQGLTRQARIAATGARNVAGAEMQLFAQQRDLLATLPGGRESQVYAETNARYREAMLQHFGEQDIVNFGIPSAQISGALQRTNYLPFMPSNVMGLSLRQFNLNRGQIGTLQARMGRLRASGDLSETEELRLTEQIEGLRTQNAQTVGMLSEGMENRLPALSAGAPAFFSRMNSSQLAAMRLFRAGSPARFAGAMNGAQLQMQDDFVRGMGGSESLIHPYSRTSGMNTSEALLERIARGIERMADGGRGGNGGKRPSEAAGQVAGMLATKAIDRQALYNAAH